MLIYSLGLEDIWGQKRNKARNWFVDQTLSVKIMALVDLCVVKSYQSPPQSILSLNLHEPIYYGNFKSTIITEFHLGRNIMFDVAFHTSWRKIEGHAVLKPDPRILASQGFLIQTVACSWEAVRIMRNPWLAKKRSSMLPFIWHLVIYHINSSFEDLILIRLNWI